MFNLKLFFMQLKNKLDENYLGGEYYLKEYNFFGKIFKRKLLYPNTPACVEYYELPKVYLSITAILKNEAPYIKEWIEYHKMLGVERFYLYDNESEDNLQDVLQPYINSGLVYYHLIKGKGGQNSAYRDAVYKYKDQTTWMAFIDIDEFILPVEKDSISEFLKDYEKYSGVGINWVVFDSNGHIQKPTEHGGLVIANYFKTHADGNMKVNRHIKTIAKPKDILSVPNPHFFYYKNNKLTVDENKKNIYGPFTDKHNVAKIRINHYYCKSKEEYLSKISKGRASCDGYKPYEDEALNFTDYKYDYAMEDKIKKLEQIMLKKRS